MRWIVVTGLGAVTPLAAGVEASWVRLLAGRSGIRRLPDDVVGDLPAKIGGVIPSLEEDPDAGFDPNMRSAMASASEALTRARCSDAGRTSWPTRVPEARRIDVFAPTFRLLPTPVQHKEGSDAYE